MTGGLSHVCERRVHIVPLGYGHDRIVEPVSRAGADLVYLLIDHPDRTAERGHVDFDAITAGPVD